MKRIIKLKKIYKHSKHVKSYLSKKKFGKKKLFLKKILYNQIESPLNTNEYLMQNKSSPFYPEDEDSTEDLFQIEPNYIITLEKETQPESVLLSIKGLESTSDESMMSKDQTNKGKDQIEIRLENDNK